MENFKFGFLNNTAEPLIFNKWGDINLEDYVGKEVIILYRLSNHGTSIRLDVGILSNGNGFYTLHSITGIKRDSIDYSFGLIAENTMRLGKIIEQGLL